MIKQRNFLMSENSPKVNLKYKNCFSKTLTTKQIRMRVQENTKYRSSITPEISTYPQSKAISQVFSLKSNKVQLSQKYSHDLRKVKRKTLSEVPSILVMIKTQKKHQTSSKKNENGRNSKLWSAPINTFQVNLSPFAREGLDLERNNLCQSPILERPDSTFTTYSKMATVSCKTAGLGLIDLDLSDDSMMTKSKLANTRTSSIASPSKPKTLCEGNLYYTVSTDTQTIKGEESSSEIDLCDSRVQTPKPTREWKSALQKLSKNKRVSDYHLQSKRIPLDLNKWNRKRSNRSKFTTVFDWNLNLDMLSTKNIATGSLTLEPNSPSSLTFKADLVKEDDRIKNLSQQCNDAMVLVARLKEVLGEEELINHDLRQQLTMLALAQF